MYKNQITAVSTDGKRLAVAKCNLSPNQSELKNKIEFILAVKTVYEIQKIIKEEKEDIFFCADKNKIGFDLKHTQLITRPIEGEFPSYDQYIPKPDANKIIINRREFLAALKRAAILSTYDYQGVKIEAKKDNLALSKATPQVGEVQENLNCNYTGKHIIIGFNPNYLIDVLRNIEEEEINFELYGADKPAVLRKNNYIYLVLPIKI